MLNNVKYSVIIPTYNHLEDCLKPCLESLKKFTSLEDVEIIIVANGCKDKTVEYINSLGHPFKLICIKEAIGYTKATNIGIKAAIGQYIILLNNDTVFLNQTQNDWLKILVQPFLSDEKVGATGPLSLYDTYADREVLIFFCVMIKREMFDKIGYLDESYSPGGGEDIDFCVKLQDLGFRQVRVPENCDVNMTWTNEGTFPIFHLGEATFNNKDFPEYSKRIVKDNGLKNMIKYNKHIKLNLGAGGVEIPGYISVDKFDTRAHILMDAENLNLPFDSVEEIVASHLFEHINPWTINVVLKNWFDILKCGGKLILEMPDIEQLCKAFITANKQDRYGYLNNIYAPVNTTGEGSTSDVTSYHKWGWYPEILFDHLSWTGFTDINFMPEQFPHPGFNFRCECKKPER
jgi:glycosyltransferase involved in cell wall biosynthesis